MKKQNGTSPLLFLYGVALAELYTHLGFCVSPVILWEIAYSQGFRPPTRDYWEFELLLTIGEVNPNEKYNMPLRERILTEGELLYANEIAQKATFIRRNDV